MRSIANVINLAVREYLDRPQAKAR